MTTKKTLFLTVVLSVLLFVAVLLGALFIPRDDLAVSAVSSENQRALGADEALVDYSTIIYAPTNSAHTVTAPNANWFRHSTTNSYNSASYFENITVFLMSSYNYGDGDYITLFKPVRALYSFGSPNAYLFLYDASDMVLRFTFNENTLVCKWEYSNGEFLVYSMIININPFFFPGAAEMDSNMPLQYFITNALCVSQRYVKSKIPQNIYDNGYAGGKGDVNQLYQQGYDAGFAAGSSQNADTSEVWKQGYNSGFAAGSAAGGSGDASFVGLISAVVDAPIKAISGLLDFEILGVNMVQFFFSLFTLCIIIAIIKVVV